MAVETSLVDKDSTQVVSTAVQMELLIHIVTRVTMVIFLTLSTVQSASAQTELKVRFAEWFDGHGLYLPPGDDTHPCILVLHGSEGGMAGWSHAAAILLALHGFAALPWSYSRGASFWHAGDIHDVDLDGTEAALNRFRQSDTIACTKVGIYGVSRGAEHALLLTSLLAAEEDQKVPDAVAVHASTDTIQGAFFADRMLPDGSYDSRGQYDSTHKA